MTWLVRPEGSTRPPAIFATAQAVADALKDGDIAAADEVRGPADAGYRPLDTHPAFAEVCEELDAPLPAPEEDANLDMNPLIDVALVLLIFFILTATYSTLTRSLALPPQPANDGAASRNPTPKELKSQALTVAAKMDGTRPIVTLEGKTLPVEDLERELTALVKAGSRKEVLFDIGRGVPWWVTVKFFEAARGAEVRQTWLPAAKAGK